MAQRSTIRLTQDMDSISLSDDVFGTSVTSATSSTKSKRLVGAGIWFKWSSSNDFLLFATVCSIHTWCFSILIRNMNKESSPHPTIIHFFLMFVFVGLPWIYMQVSIGQYTQRGVICIKEICPIVHGTAYTAFLSVVVRCTNIGITISVIIIYLLSSLTSNLQWLTCPKFIIDICWNSQNNCTHECLTRFAPSARLYYLLSHVGLSKSMQNDDPLKWLIKKFLPLVTCWALLIICLGFIRVTYRKLVTITLCTAAFLFSIVFCGCALTKGGFQFTSYIMAINWEGFLSVDAWAIAFYESFQMLNLGRPLHFVTGTFLGPNAHTALLSISVTMIAYLVLIVMSILALSTFGILTVFSYTNKAKMEKVWFFTEDEVIFTIIPQAFDFMNVPQFWSFVYFSSCLLIDMNCLIINIIILEKCFVDAHPKLQRYRVYTVLVIVTLIFFIGVLFYRNTKSFENFATVSLAAEFCEMINVTIMVMAICILYGVQRLCDDVHFMSANPPTQFWKISWYLMPLIYPVLTVISIKYYMNIRLRTGRSAITNVLLISMGVFLSPALLFCVIKILQYMKRKNLVGMFKATDLYGSTDPEERHLRKVHNPRTEFRSKRKNDACAHRCFMNNRAFRKAVLEEQRAPLQSESSSSELRMWRAYSEEITT